MKNNQLYNNVGTGNGNKGQGNRGYITTIQQ